MAKVPVIKENETRIFSVPVFDFNGQTPNVLRAGQTTLKVDTDGTWLVWGAIALLAQGPAGALPSGTPIAINFLNPSERKWWYSGGTAADNTGLPLKLVAGKGGNACFYDYPKLLQPSDEIMLYASHGAVAAPTAASRLYVALICTLDKIRYSEN